MLARICYELNGMEPNRVNTAKRIIEEELENLLRAVIIDEADRLPIKNIEHLRDIHDAICTPFILVGEPSIYAKLNPHKRLKQRVTRSVEFGPVIAEDVIIFGFKACGLKIDPEAAILLQQRSHGSFRLLYHLMRDLEMVAKANDTTQVNSDLVNIVPDRRLKPKPE